MLVVDSGGAAAVNLGNEGGVSVGGSDSAGGDEGDRNSAGNRWPREETLVLLQVRQSMDEAFRDSNLKAPLWDEVSRYSCNFRIYFYVSVCMYVSFLCFKRSATCFACV